MVADEIDAASDRNPCARTSPRVEHEGYLTSESDPKVVDQSMTTFNTGATDADIWQSFVANQTGSLMGISFNTNSCPTETGTVTSTAERAWLARCSPPRPSP